MSRGGSLSRRTVLRGGLVTLALPVLSSALPRSVRAAAPSAKPIFITMFGPNGQNMPSWLPTTTGPDWVVSPTLTPLASWRARMTVVSGLTHTAGLDRAPGFHARQTASFLTVRPLRPLTETLTLTNDWSLDQIVASERDADMPVASLALGTPQADWLATPGAEWPFVYHATISWRGNVPVPNLYNPRMVWQRLLGGGATGLTPEAMDDLTARRKSVLDELVGDVASLRQRLGAEDDVRLDEYLTGVRDLELRLDRVTPAACGPLPTDADWNPDEPALSEVMLDLMVMAIECGATRVATYMFSADGSGRTFSEYGHTLDHHALSHHDPSDTVAIQQLDQIGSWEVSRVARVVDRLGAAANGEGGSLLDDTVLLYGSGMSDGNAHSPYDLPIVLVGDAGGRLTRGQHLRFEDAPLENLHQTLLHALGMPERVFPRANGVLPGLLT